jgi:hypothetical protein
VVTAVFADQLGRATALPVRPEVAHRKIARGTVQATARLDRPRAEVIAELDAGTRPELPVTIEITREDGSVAAEMRIIWILRPN